MKTFQENVELIKDTISDELYNTLIKLSNISNDLDDSIKKLTIELMLEDEYNKSLDWLYSTLCGQEIHRNLIH